MARSNGPLPPQSGAGRTTRPDPQSWAQGTPPRQAAPRPAQPQAQPQYAPQSAGAAYQQAAYGAQNGASDPRYASQQPQARQPDPRQQPAAAQRPAATSSAFDSFLSQQQPAAAASSFDVTTGGRQAGYSKPAAQTYGQAGQGYAAPEYGRAPAQTDQNGYGQWGNTPAPAADARGFDYGGYGAPASTGNTGYAQPAQGYGNQQHFDHGATYGQDEWQGDGYGQEPSLDGSLDHSGYAQDQHGSIEQSYEDDDYEDEPRSRRRLPLIAAAVAGALLCGGGLAYGYKTFLGPVASSNTPLIRGAEGPLKVKPDDPGGRKFANTQSNVMGGSGSGGNKIMGEPLADGAAGGEGARKVQTVEVRPDGSVVPQSGSMGDPSHNSSRASMSDFPTAGETGSVGRDAPAAPPQVIAKAEPTPPPAATRTPPPAPEPEATMDETPPAAAPPKKVAAKKVAPSAAPEGPIGPAPTGAGWVAVLASVPVSSSSQMDSLKQFADMQQKYGDVLGDKTPSVQEANLGEKGRYHRLVVGPPSSRDSASSICGSLKTAGYSGCWVMQY